MSKILDRLNERFRLLAEQQNQSGEWWKDPNSQNYDRQVAEDALFHTVGPLTETPQWMNADWSSPGTPVPGYNPGGPAPRWTEYEVVMAYAGDPSLLFTAKDNPRSPLYGNKGGAPLFRLAKRVARHYARPNDRSFIEDLYGNGMIGLATIMKPGYDAGAKGYTDKEGNKRTTPFILFAKRTIQSAMEHGIGGSQRTSRAAGEESTTGLRGMKALLKETDPNRIREAAETVKGKYRETRSHDKNDDNPFGPFSSAYYQICMAYADALESGEEDQIEKAQNRMRQLIDEIEDFEIPIRGASSGLGQAISTPDRVKKNAAGERINPINIQSMDVNDDEGSSAAGNIPTDIDVDWVDPESIEYVLDIAINYDLGKLLKSSKKYNEMAIKFKAKLNKSGGAKIGGPMTAQELRYTIRRLGPVGSNYPGKGKPRENTNTPRDAKNWWQPGEDPEIEPIPNGGLWHSAWSRNGYDSMQPTEIGNEMTNEVLELHKLGIESARTERVLNGEPAIGKVGVSNTTKAGIIKFKIIADIHRHELGMDESNLRKGLPILESLSKIDRLIIAETCDWIVSRLAIE